MQTPIKEDTSCYASREQRHLLETISTIDIIATNFFLTGGTALSVFYFHHRSSEDLDFFSTHFRQLGLVNQILKRTFKNDLALVQSSPDFHSYLLLDVKVDFVFDPLSTADISRPLASLEAGKNIYVDTLLNISSNKLCAIASRFEAKDIVDFYFLSKTLWSGREEGEFFRCYESARKKEALLDDPAMAAYQIEQLLAQVLSQKEKLPLNMKQEVDWHSFENDLRFYIDILYNMQHW